MKLDLSLLVFLWMVVQGASDATVKILAGRTGNGKSYLVTLTGCYRPTCPGTDSCSKETYICSNNVVDTIGLDDDGYTSDGKKIDYTIAYEGKSVSLSGLTYPVYSLFDTLEKAGVTEAEFYLVYDANNLKLGSTAQFFLNFVKNDLKCPVNTVLNKYRDEAHSALPGQFDIRVAEGAKSLDLKGKGCVLSLAKDWREKVIMSDLAGIRSRVDRENCNKLKERKTEFEEVRKALPKALSTSNCGVDMVDHFEKDGNDWNVNIMGLVSFGGGGGTRAIMKRVVDGECARKDEIKNESIKAENAALAQKQTAVVAAIESIDKGLVECKNFLSGWQ